MEHPQSRSGAGFHEPVVKVGEEVEQAVRIRRDLAGRFQEEGGEVPA